MTAQTRAVNKAKFEQGDTPQGADYVDLIDSFLSLSDTTVQSMTSDLSTQVLVATEVSAPIVNTDAFTASASSKFKNNLSITGTLEVSSSTRFHKPMRGDGGGLIVQYQVVTVDQQNTAGNVATVTVPSSADIIDFYFVSTAAWGHPGDTTTAANIEVGVSGSTLAFGTFPVSAAENYTAASNVGFAASNWVRYTTNLVGNGDNTGKIQALASIQGSGTNLSVGEGRLTVMYVSR